MGPYEKMESFLKQPHSAKNKSNSFLIPIKFVKISKGGRCEENFYGHCDRIEKKIKKNTIIVAFNKAPSKNGPKVRGSILTRVGYYEGCVFIDRL